MAVDLRSNCLLQYRMNETTPLSILLQDFSGNGAIGEASEAIEDMSTASGVVDRALVFDTTNDVEVLIPFTLSGNWTITFWLNWTDGTGRPNGIFGKDSDANNSLSIINTAGTSEDLTFVNSSGTSTTWTGLSIEDGWHWITLISIAGGEQIQLWIDNVFISTKTPTGGAPTATTFYFQLIGKGADGVEQLEGEMDILNIFDTNISEADRDVLWNDGDGTELLTPGVFTYSVSLNKIVATTGTANDPVTFHSMYEADQAGAGTILLVAESGADDNTLTYPIRPTHDKALKVKCIVASKTAEADYIFITGTDAWGAAQTESLNVTAGNGTYETTKRFATITNLDCSDNAAGGGTVWADGTIAVTQDIWGVVWENAENGQYKIDANVDFGDGSTSTYFHSFNEMIYFEDDMMPFVTANATLEIGDLIGDWAVYGSVWSVSPSASFDITTSGQAATFLLYGSMITNRNSTTIDWHGGTVDIINSTMQATARSTNQYKFYNTLTSISYRDVIFRSLGSVAFYKDPAVSEDIHLHDIGNGALNALNDVTITGLLVTSPTFSETGQLQDKTLTLKDPKFSPSIITISAASGAIIEQYTTNIHVTDSDGADLADVDVDCGYAHLVEGSDSKTYKCIQDHTSVDAVHKPITGSDWESFWELYDASGGLGGIWQTTYDFKAGAEEFTQDTTDADGDISEQVIQYKKWVGTSEVLEARIHKFTFGKDGVVNEITNVIVDAPIDWRVEFPSYSTKSSSLVNNPLINS